MTNEQLNRLCAEKVMGWGLSMTKKFWMIDTSELQSPFIKVEEWNPCENISQAWMLIDKTISKDKRIQFDVEYDEGAWLASFWIHSQPDDEDMPLNVAEQADTAPLAIVKACLKAVE